MPREFTETLDQAVAAESSTPTRSQAELDQAAFSRLSGGGKGKRAASAKPPAKGKRSEGETRASGGTDKGSRRQAVRTTADEVRSIEDARKRGVEASRQTLDEEWAALPEAPATPDEDTAGERAEGEDAGADDHDPASPQENDEGEAPTNKGIAGLSVMQLAALRRADTPQEIIDSLPDAALVSLAEHEIKRQKAVDAALSRQTKADKAAVKTEDEPRETTVSEDRESGDSSRGAVPEPPRSADLKRVVRPLRESLGLDEEDEPKVADAFAAYAKNAREELLAELAPVLKKQSQLLQGIEDERRAESKRSAMREAEAIWPRLADTQEKGKVKALTDELLSAGSYPPGLSYGEAVVRCTEDACFKVLGPPGIAPKPRESTPRPSSTPSEADARRAAPRQPSKRERDSAVFKALRRGEHRQGDIAGLQRAAGIAV